MFHKRLQINKNSVLIEYADITKLIDERRLKSHHFFSTRVQVAPEATTVFKR